MQEFFDNLLKDLRYNEIGHEIEFRDDESLDMIFTDDDIELAQAEFERVFDGVCYEHDIDTDTVEISYSGDAISVMLLTD